MYSPRTRRLAVIDFPRSPNSFAPDGTYLLSVAVMQVLKGTVPKRVHMVYSHRHFDHIGFAGVFHKFIEETFPRAKIFVWGTKEAKEFIQRKETTDVPLPVTIIPKSDRTLSISRSLKVQFSILGGHTDSDVLAYIPPSHMQKGVVHYVDVITAGVVPFIQFSITSDLGRYLVVHKKLLSLDFDFISTGHGKIGDKKDVRKNMEFTEFVVVAAKEAAEDVDAREMGAIFGRMPKKMMLLTGMVAGRLNPYLTYKSRPVQKLSLKDGLVNFLLLMFLQRANVLALYCITSWICNTAVKEYA